MWTLKKIEVPPLSFGTKRRKKYLPYSYDNQKVAAQGNAAAIAEVRPLNLLMFMASFIKSVLALEA